MRVEDNSQMNAVSHVTPNSAPVRVHPNNRDAATSATAKKKKT